jgi:hypothetical protein
MSGICLNHLSRFFFKEKDHLSSLVELEKKNRRKGMEGIN